MKNIEILGSIFEIYWNYVLNNSSQRVDIPYEKHINKCEKIKRNFSVEADSFLLYLPKIILNPTPTNPIGSFTLKRKGRESRGSKH